MEKKSQEENGETNSNFALQMRNSPCFLQPTVYIFQMQELVYIGHFILIGLLKKKKNLKVRPWVLLVANNRNCCDSRTEEFLQFLGNIKCSMNPL